MSENVNLNSPSYQPALYRGAQTGASLLAGLMGHSSRESPAGADQDTPMDPGVRRDITRFAQALAVAESPSRLLADPSALRVLLTAHGLGDQADNMALAVQALLSDATNPSALVHQLSDPRWLGLNRIFSFAAKGLSVLRDPVMINTVARRFAEAMATREGGKLA